MPPANLSLLPWIRQGAAGAINTVDTLGSAQPAAADVSVVVQVNTRALPAVPLRLRGPADVVGIDRHQVVRTDPPSNTSDFEPNCFPSIELDRADFPWLFTPARANTNGQLRPWLCLVAVRQQPGVQLTSVPDAPLPQLRIVAPAKPFIELPDLKDCWAWAHGQAAADSTVDPNGVGAALNGAPHLSLSRLISPRLLTPNTEYLACLVPTFALGVKAGLGQAIADTELTATNAMAPAWTVTATGPTQVQLPVYYSWQFRTGEGGDFASLARNLKIRGAAGLGRRTVAIGQPGFAVPGLDPRTTVEVEGALMPLTGATPPVVWSDPAALKFELALEDIVNRPGMNQVTSPAADPLVAPPIYGRWYAGRATVTPAAANWLDALNLDPRWRSAAAFGTEVIQQHQEALMASAWEQAAEIQPVNQRLRQLQISMAVGESLHARHLFPLSEDMTLRFASPAFGRLWMPTPEIDPAGRTVATIMAGTSLPIPATRTAMRRIGRQRGPLSRRIAAKGAGRSADATWVAFLNLPGGPAAPAPPAIVRAPAPPLSTLDAVVGAIWNRNFVIAAENQPLAPLPPSDLLPPGWDYPGHFRKAATDHLARVGLRPDASLITHVTMRETVDVVREQMHPRVALANLV